MSDLHFRPYTDADQDSCIEIFKSNTPQFFGVQELGDFQKFLDTLPCPYYVVTRDQEVLACGGYGVDNKKNTVALAWGMARRDVQKQGLGAFLLLERLKQIYKDYGDTIVDIDTSQHSKGFFERFGFEAGNVTENYYAPGLHRVDMQLTLNQERYNMLNIRLIE
jgi:GNAT superfamily N-acetyltransferase